RRRRGHRRGSRRPRAHLSGGSMSVRAAIGPTITVEDLERDPYTIYRRLRDQEPVSWVEEVGLWLITRWDDVEHVDLHPDLFTGETEPSTLNRTFGKNLLGSEGDDHSRIRSIIEPAFRPGTVRPYANEVIEPLAHELLDAVAHLGQVDLMPAFAEPLSVRVLQQVLGLAEVPVETLMRWFEHLGIGASNFEFDPQKQAVADAASAEVDGTLAGILDRLDAEPDGSILSRMQHSEVEGHRLRREEIASNLKVMMVGWMQEPGDLIGIATWALL